jgi:(1->4)-alpha-D-glucan 1-alpha-D-glucosylmutase
MSLPCCEYKNKMGQIAQSLAQNPDDQGRIKLFLTWRGLKARQQHAFLFQSGEYIPLQVEGAKAKHILAFARRVGDSTAILAVPRLWAQLTEKETPIANPEMWQDTSIQIPAEWPEVSYRNEVTSEECLAVRGENGVNAISAASLFQVIPWALLVTTPRNPQHINY